MRRLAALCALALLALCAAPAGAATHAFTVHYEGSYAWHQDWEGASTSAGSYLRTNETLSWVVDISGTTPAAGQATDLHVKLVAQGTIDQQGSDPNSNEHCTITQVSGGGTRDVSVGRNSDGTLNVGLQIPASNGPDVSVTGNHQNCDEFSGSVLFCDSTCAGATVCGAVPPAWHDQSFSDARTPGLNQVKDVTKAFDVGGPRATEKVACNDGGTESTQIAITSSVRVGAGGRATHKPPGGKHIPTIEKQKVFAKSDFLTSLFRAEAACGQVVLGTTAVVWGLAVPAESAAAAAIAGDIILAGSGPTCVSLVNRLTDDARIVNDPPRRDFDKIATPRPVRTPVTLPDCAKEPQGPPGFCDALRKDELAYIAAVRKATAVAGALQLTVYRESGAAKAGKATALKRQERAGRALVAQLRSASKTERTAGAKLAALLKSHSVIGRLTADQADGGLKHVTAALAKRKAATPSLPAAVAIDLVAAFTR